MLATNLVAMQSTLTLLPVVYNDFSSGRFHLYHDLSLATDPSTNFKYNHAQVHFQGERDSV